MVPAQQRLAADRTPGVDGDDRLVHEVQLVAVERTAQGGVEVESAGGLAAQLVAERLDPGPAPLLGQVHRRVGVAQQAGRELPPAWLTATPALTVTMRSARSIRNGLLDRGR